MATKPHKSLTGSDLHEPKGIELAAAGQVYVADGAGSGSWVAVDIQAAWSTGDVKLTYKAAPDTGWLMMDDTSIGAPGSGADIVGGGYNALFTLLWTVIPASVGLIQPSRGGSAASDWAAGKKCLLPKVLGRALAVAGAGSGLTARTLGSVVGAETHSLTANENGPHDHVAAGTTGTSNQSLNHAHAVGFTTASGLNASINNSGSPAPLTAPGPTLTGYADLSSHNHNFSVTTTTSGLGAAHNNMQPTAFMNVMIKV